MRPQPSRTRRDRTNDISSYMRNGQFAIIGIFADREQSADNSDLTTRRRFLLPRAPPRNVPVVMEKRANECGVHGHRDADRPGCS